MKDNERYRRDLILASALLHTTPPTERATANCSRVLRRALTAAGLWHDAFQDDFNGEQSSPVVRQWYRALIALTRPQPGTEQLMKGGGDLTTPAGAHFTGCWLTPAGEAEATRILQEHPEWEIALRR